MKMKFINDPVHGLIGLTELQDELIHTPEIQRMAWIRQLGLTKIVFPGANNTRLEHGLGTSFVTGLIAEHLKLNEHETKLLQAAALLHDIGHTPFSHTLESIYEKIHKKDHMDYTAELITGKSVQPIKHAGRIPEILERYELKPKDVAELVQRKFTGKKYLQSIIFGELDADQMDFLARDAHYSGSTYGIIDIERSIRTMQLVKNEICFIEKGIPSIESFLIARDLMYSTVYVHHTVRIAEMMLLRAMESAVDKIPTFYSMTDGELLTKLSEANPYAEEMAGRILRRELLKRAYEISSLGVKDAEMKKLKKAYSIGAEKLEEKIIQKTGLKKGSIIVDMPAKSLELSEPRLKQIKIKIVRKNGKVEDIYSISAIARALSKKESTFTLLSVYSEKQDCDKVRKAMEKILSE